DVISIETNLILLNVVVTDSGGSYVSGLQAKDFEVFEDGKLQKITTFGAESTPFAAVILLDTSGSMEQRMPLARSAAIKFLEGLRDEDSAAVYNFDSKVKLIQDFSASRDLQPVAFNLKADGMTVLNDSIVEASKMLSERPEKRRAIIVLSDGADTRSKYSQDKALKAAIAANSTIYTVDISSLDGFSKERTQSIGALKSFADKSGGKFVPVSGGGELRDAFKKIIEELSVQYTIGYEPNATVRDGKFHAIIVKTKSQKPLQIRTRKGYNAPKSDKK
ncbi:MAG: VWA domain-containing protein, partial [Pyrinomonadaceae bacterium]|nr:VWA domain-containing protein [Pyrinomonadaceae bacterium]